TADCPAPGTCGPTTTCRGGARAGLACASDVDCPGGECGPALFEFRNRLSGGAGPVVAPRAAVTQGVCDDTGLPCPPATAARAPLAGPAATSAVSPRWAVEAIGGTPSGGADAPDRALTRRGRDGGQVLPIGASGATGRAIARVSGPPFTYPAVAGEGDVVAF